MKLTIAVRFYGGTYIARTVKGQRSANASCTASAERAVERCAQKAFGHENFTISEDPTNGKIFTAEAAS